MVIAGEWRGRKGTQRSDLDAAGLNDAPRALFLLVVDPFSRYGSIELGDRELVRFFLSVDPSADGVVWVDCRGLGAVLAAGFLLGGMFLVGKMKGVKRRLSKSFLVQFCCVILVC